MDNAQQIEYWNGPVGERWARLQDTLDRSLGNISQNFISFVNAKPGQRLLDVGCGCGTTTFTFAECVRPGGSVAGVDISQPMLAVARARAQAGNAEIPFVEADASSHDFQPTFDIVVSRFGVMFFAEPAAAFRNIRRALVPQGTLAFVCWRAPAENAWVSAPMAAAKPFLPPQEPVDPLAPGPFAFADKAHIDAILDKAGFGHIHVEKFDGHMDMGASLADAATHSLNVGPLARAAAELDETTREKISNAVARALEPYKTGRGVHAPVACWFVRAKNG